MTANQLNEFDAKLSQANKQLAFACCRVTIKRRGKSLYLRATLPPKPDSDRTKAFQQDIALKVKATPQGLQRATAEAKKISAALDLKEFCWADYLVCTGEKSELRLISEWKVIYEEQYFQDKERTDTHLNSFRFDHHNYLKRLPQDKLPSQEILEQIIRTTKPDTRARVRICSVYKRFCQVVGIDDSFIDKNLRGNYSSRKAAPRNLPEDDEIVKQFYKISEPGVRWVYGIIATYGLRPHEVFHLNTKKMEQGGYILEVLDQTKTGYREVRPLHPEWIEQFGLRTKYFPNYRFLDRCNCALGKKVLNSFKYYNIPFLPYNLRHSYAVRCANFGVPVAFAARWMGHSAQIHTQVYQRWIQKDLEDQVFERLINASNRPCPPNIKPDSSNTTESFSDAAA